MVFSMGCTSLVHALKPTQRGQHIVNDFNIVHKLERGTSPRTLAIAITFTFSVFYLCPCFVLYFFQVVRVLAQVCIGKFKHEPLNHVVKVFVRLHSNFEQEGSTQIPHLLVA